MPTSDAISERRKVSTTADLLRRGASLLNESCPRCGGVQISYQGKTYCVNEDDMSALLSKSEKSASIAQPSAAGSSVSTPASATREKATNSERDSLRKLLEEKLALASKQLENSQDLDEQEKLLGLISKYLETLEKIKARSPEPR